MNILLDNKKIYFSLNDLPILISDAKKNDFIKIIKK